MKVTSLKLKVERKRAFFETCAREWRLVFFVKRLLVVICVGLGLAVTSCAAYYDDLGTLEKINGEMTKGNEFADMFTVDGEAFFPIGIWGTHGTSYYQEMKDHGINFLVVWLNDERMAKIKEVGLYACSQIYGQYDSQFIKYLNENRVLYWYSYDEPYFNNISPEIMLDAYNIIKNKDSRPVFYSISPSGDTKSYLSSYDILGVDEYPIPYTSPVNVYKRIIIEYIKTNYSKPIINNIQAFPWGNKRPPSPEELRVMVYLSLIANAKGIAYFSFGFSGWFLPNDKDLWSMIREVNSEILKIKDVLVLGKQTDIVSTNNIHIKYRTISYNGKIFLICANSQNTHQKIIFKFSTQDLTSITNYLSDENFNINQNIFVSSFSPYQTVVYAINKD